MNSEYKELLEDVKNTLEELSVDVKYRVKLEIEKIIKSFCKIEEVFELIELQERPENLKEIQEDTYFITDISNLINDIEDVINSEKNT